MNEEIRKLEKRFINLEKMVNNHYKVLNELCKDMADLWKRWYSIAGISIELFKALAEMDAIREGVFRNQKFLEGKVKELEEQHKNFIIYHESKQYHPDKKTNKYHKYIS